MPEIVRTLAGNNEPHLAWRNELAGQTWQLGNRYLKWNPRTNGIDLTREIGRLRWLDGRHPAPRVLATGEDETAQWMLTAAISGESAVEPHWRAQPALAVRAIAAGLRVLHALPTDDIPADWESWVSRAPASLGPRPPDVHPVLLHGDACSPNTMVDAKGQFVAHVDVGAMALGDRWADLAIAARSLQWNYGPGWEPLFFESYGVAPDHDRMAWYRALCDLET